MAAFNSREFPPTGDIVSRDDAAARGQDIYFVGTTCKRGHSTWRYVSNNWCVECSRLWYAEKYLREKTADANKNRNARQRMIRRIRPEINAMSSLKYRARVFGLEFSLTKADLVYPERCQCCDQVMEIGATPTGAPVRNAPSIDRIDPKKGYTPDNIAFLCYRCNFLKRDGSIKEFEQIIDYMRRMASRAVAVLRLVEKEKICAENG